MAAENLVALDKQLVILDKAGAYINGINTIDYLFRSGDWFEIFAFSHNGADDAVVMLVWNGL